MKKINFEITENDVKHYLKQHKNDEDFMYREAMFIKYLKEETIIKKETLEMLMEKYNFDNIIIDGTHYYKNNGTIVHQSLSTFSNYLFGINNLDISGICHILIPTMKYYGSEDLHINSLCVSLENILDKLLLSPNYSLEVIESTLDDYRICEKIKTSDFEIKIKMGKEHCRKELQEYSYIYGDKME